MVLRLVGREAEPGKSREHALLSILAERRLCAGKDAPIDALVGDVLDPPLAEIAAMALDDFLSPKARKEFDLAINIEKILDHAVRLAEKSRSHAIA